MITLLLATLLIKYIAAEEACCGCTDTSPDSFCNPECDEAVCEYDPYCCNVEWDSICADGAECECNLEDGCHIYSEPYYNNDYGDDSCGDYDDGDYGYDDDCNCDEICYGNEPEEWEFEYEEVPPCIINNCGEQLDKCASDEECVSGLENVVNNCYNSDEDPQQCMDGLIADTENAGFKSACEDNEVCATDLKALGECVANSANYGFCTEDEYKKLKLKSVLKTVKKKSRKLKRKSSAKKHKSKRSKKKGKKGKKKRGKRKSKLRKSSRKLLNEDGTEYQGSDEYDSQYDQYENPENDYGCYCECGEEEEEIPDCILNNCGEQLYACGSIDDCIDGVEGVIQQCYEDNDSPQQCMDELMAEAGSAQAIQLCNGNEEAGAALQALGTCVINSANYGDCSEDEYKKLKVKALVKATKKVRARKTAAASKKKRRSRARVSRKRLNLRRLRKGYRARPKARSRRAVSRTQRQRGARASRRKLLSERNRPRPRSRAASGQRLKRKRALAKRERARRVRSEKLRSRKRQRRSRRKLLNGDGDGCCECTDEDEIDGPKCNKECDKTICGYDPYCCKVEWDWICAEAAEYECSGDEPGDSYGSYYDYGDYDYYGDYYGSYGNYYGDYDDYEYYGDYYGSYGDYDYGDYEDSYDYGDYEDYGDYGSYGDDYEYSDSYDYGDYDSYGTGGVYDYYYDYYDPSSYDYYDIDGDEYNYDYGDSYDDTYDIGDSYNDWDEGSDYWDDSDTSEWNYPPPKGGRKQRSRRSLLAQKSQRQRRQRPRSGVAGQQGLRKRALAKRERQRRARSLKGKRTRARRQRLQRRARR